MRLLPYIYLAAALPLQATIYHIEPGVSLDLVSSRTYQPGDEILFRAGGTWTGSLRLKGSGTPSASIKVGRVGSGDKPMLQGMGQVTSTVELVDGSYWEISDLEITNAGDPDGYHNGLLVTSTSSQRYHHIYVRRVDVRDVDCASNSGGGGIRMDAVLSDVLIDGCTVRNIGGNGIDVHSNYAWIIPKVQSTFDPVASEDIVIQNCTTSFCGDSGIWIWGAKHPVIQDCTAFECNIGAHGAYVGIWIMHTEDALIQRNNSYSHRKSWDGECIDVDVLCFRAVVQYNYVHDNDHVGIIVYGYDKDGEHLPTNGVIVRYNIAENCDGSFALAGNQLTNTHFYNNTSYTTDGKGQIVGVPHNGIVGGSHHFENNIFYGGEFDLSRFGDAEIEFASNCFYDIGGTVPHGSGSILSDPQLVSPGTGPSGYLLQSDSPCIDAGVAVAGSPDYFSNPAPVGERDAGAHEFQGGSFGLPAPPSGLRILE